jgi:glutamate 5-kinase
LKSLRSEISQDKSTQGTGGMQSKIEAAEILQKEGIETWIVNGIKDNFILNAIDGKSAYTRIK